MSVGTITKTLGHVAARSYAHTANALMHLACAIATGRGLDLQYLRENLDVVSAGLRTWLVGHNLEFMRVEVWDPGTDRAAEVYEFRLNYEPIAADRAETFDVRTQEVEAEIARLHKLPPGLRWRIVVSTKPGSPAVPGWSATKLRDASHLGRRDGGEVISSAGCTAGLTYFTEGGNDA
jgi:Bacterial HORMA domain 2